MKLKSTLGFMALVALAPVAWANGQAAKQSRSSTASKPATAHSTAPAKRASQPSALAINSGTKISAQLLTTLNAKKLKPGRQVEARVTQDVKQNGRVVIHKGARLIGHVTTVQASGKGNAGSNVGVAFDRLVQGHSSTALNTVVTSVLSVPRPIPMQPMGGMSEPPMGGGMPMGGGAPMGGVAPARSGGGGGGLGGTVGAVGGVGSTVGSTVGGTGSNVGSTVGGTGSAVGSTAGSTVGSAGNVGGNAAGGAGSMGNMSNNPIPVLVSNSVTSNTAASGQGSAGMSNRLGTAHLGASGSGANQTGATSTFSQRQGNLNLQSGSQLQFQVVGGAHANKPSAH